MRVRGVLALSAAFIAVFGMSGARMCSAQASHSFAGEWTGLTFANGAQYPVNIAVNMKQVGTAVSGPALVSEPPSTVISSNATGTVGSNTTSLNIGLSTYGRISATLTITYYGASGTYDLINTKQAVVSKGFIALSKVAPGSLNGIAGVYVGPCVRAGLTMASDGADMNVVQNGNSLTITLSWDGVPGYIGSGTISGNQITFTLIGQGTTPGVMTGTATVSGGNITGTSLITPPAGSTIPMVFSMSLAQ